MYLGCSTVPIPTQYIITYSNFNSKCKDTKNILNIKILRKKSVGVRVFHPHALRLPTHYVVHNLVIFPILQEFGELPLAVGDVQEIVPVVLSATEEEA